MSVAIGGVVVVVVAVVLVLLLLPTIVEPAGGASLLLRNASSIASACIAIGVFFALGTLVDLWRSFGSLSRIAETTRTRCLSLLRQPTLELHEVIFALEPYNCALARSAPIPSFIWKKHKDRLTKSWAEASKWVKP